MHKKRHTLITFFKTNVLYFICKTLEGVQYSFVSFINETFAKVLMPNLKF